jgi:hypothetical protein
MSTECKGSNLAKCGISAPYYKGTTTCTVQANPKKRKTGKSMLRRDKMIDSRNTRLSYMVIG